MDFNYFLTVIGISIYKSYYVSEQKTKNINVYNLFKHKYNTRIKDKMSLLWNMIYIYTTSEKPVNDQSYGVLDRYGITILYK